VSRRTLAVTAVMVVLALVAVGVWESLSSRVAPGTIALAGDVQADVRTVQAPAITYPSPDFSVGFPKPPGAPKSGGAPSASRSQPKASQQPTISGSIDAVYVRQGDRVNAGQKIVRLDTKVLELGVKQAQYAADKAHADVAVVGKSLDTVQTNQDKLVTARGQLATAQQQLATAGQQLATAQSQALAGRAQVVAGIAAVEAIINGPHPPGPWPPAELTAKLAQLKTTLAGIDAGLAQLPAAQALLATGKAQLATGKAQLATGAQALRDAKKQLQRAQAVLTQVAKGQDILVDLAKYRVRQATLYAPVSGIVTDARTAGTVAMVGAPLVRIMPDEHTKIVSYLAPQELTAVVVGSKAKVDFDSNTRGPLAGHVTEIALKAQFPPTRFPTSIVHMTNTVRVTVTLDNGAWAPPGTPVDLTIATNGH
jgi:multidrug efflux pump subunit AcrA (membrane-fusion protein)